MDPKNSRTALFMMVQASILFILLLLLDLDVYESLSDDRKVRDNAVCDFMHSTNVPELCSSNTWQGWNCSGSAGKYEAVSAVIFEPASCAAA